MGVAQEPPVVAVLGTRFQNFGVEESVLAPLGVRLTSGPGASREEVLETARSARVVLAGSAPRFDAATLSALAADACTGIVRYGVGVESIDLVAAGRLGLWVARVADYGTEAVATHAVSMALTAMRRLREADERVRSGQWGFAPLRPLHLPSALTAGVLGAGRIGAHAAGQFAGLGFRVLAHDPVAPPIDDPRVSMVSFDELITSVDILSLHLPGNPDGSPVLDAGLLPRLREGCIVVNTARGTLIDPDALASGLAQGRPGFAALDVFAGEPPQLAGFDGVADRMLFSPHMAWYTEESEVDLRTKAAHEVRRLLSGERPRDVVVDPTDNAETETR